MKLFCVKWPTVWRHSTLFVLLAGWQRGLTPTIVLLVGTAAVWSVATDGLSTQNIDVYGSTPSARDSGCTGPRKKWLSRLEQDGRSLPQLWRSLSSLLSRDSDITGATGHSADVFAKFFSPGRLTTYVRTATAGHPAPPVSNTTRSTMSTF